MTLFRPILFSGRSFCSKWS